MYLVPLLLKIVQFDWMAQLWHGYHSCSWILQELRKTQYEILKAIRAGVGLGSGTEPQTACRQLELESCISVELKLDMESIPMR